MAPEDQAAALAELRECARILANAILQRSPDVPFLWVQLVEAWCKISA